MEYLTAHSTAHYQAAATLFREYAAFIGIDLAFQHFEDELADLQQMYSPPGGAIVLCSDGLNWIACAGLRPLLPGIAEVKRMFVQPAYHGKGIGRGLMENVLQLARQYSYEKVRLDTLSHMTPAITLYRQYGFYAIEPYNYNPFDTVLYFEKIL